MTVDLARAIFDRLTPGWREAPLTSANRRVLCLLHTDTHPSLDIDEQRGVWICRAGCGGGGAVDFARRLLGEDGARELLRELGDGAGEPPRARAVAVEDRGPPTEKQVAALVRSRRIRGGADLERIGARLVRVWGEEWIGFPTLAPGSWKVWALDGAGRPRVDDKQKVIRLNVGHVSLVAPSAIREALESSRALGSRLFDVEGESDLLAAIATGIKNVIATTGGAGTLAGHKRHRDALATLRPVDVVVIRDLDDAGRGGAEKAATWWHALGVKVRVLTLPEALGDGGDVRDFLLGRPALNGKPEVAPLGTREHLETLAAAAPEWTAEVGSTAADLDAKTLLVKLAALSGLEYDRRREAAAKQIGVRVTTLDIEVARRRGGTGEGEAADAGLLRSWTVEPWPEPVATADLLDELMVTYRRYIILPAHGAETMALWALHAWAHDAATVSSLLVYVRDERPR